MHRTRAFTLVELVVAISIVAILVAFTVPPLLTSLQNSAANALGNSLVLSLNLARSEAVKRAATVSLCAAADATLSSCATNDAWTYGWLVFADVTGDGLYTAGNDTLLKTDTIPSGSTLSGAFNSITFTSGGFVNNATALVFTATASGCVNNNALTITVRNPGEIISTPAPC